MEQSSISRLVIICFICISTSFAYFQNGGGLIYNPGDSNYSMNPVLDYFRANAVVDWKQSFGIEESLSIAKAFPYDFLLVILSSLPVNASMIQLILFSCIIFVGLVGAYNLIEVESAVTRFVFSFLYLFNPYTITLILGGSNFMPLFMLIGLPYLIRSYFLLIQGMSSSGMTNLVIGLLITKASLTNPMYGLPFILFILSTILTNFTRENFTVLLRVSVVSMIVYADLVAGLIINLEASKDALIKSTIDLNILYFVPGGASVFKSLALIPHWGFFGSYSGERYYTYATLFEEIRYVDFSALITILLLIIFVLKIRDTDRRARTYLVYFFLALFFVVGSNPPLGAFYNLFLSISGLSYPLRESHDKATAALALSSLVIVSYFFSSQSLVRFKPLASFKITLILLFVAVSFWSGNFFRDKGILLGGTRHPLPQSYLGLANSIENGNLLRILVLPPQWISVPGIQSMMIDGHFYTGPDPIDRLTAAQLLYPTRFSYDSSNTLREDIFYDLTSYNPKLSIDYLTENGVDGILLRNDFSSITYRYNMPAEAFRGFLKDKRLSTVHNDEIFWLVRINE